MPSRQAIRCPKRSRRVIRNEKRAATLDSHKGRAHKLPKEYKEEVDD